MIVIESENQMKIRAELESAAKQLDQIRMHEGCDSLTVEVNRNGAVARVREGTKHRDYFDLKEVDQAKKACDEFAVAMETARAAAVAFQEQMMILKEKGLL